MQWITSFLTDRTQQVAYQGTLSKLQRLLYGVPQGSVLGPLLFNMYAADISKVVESHGHKLHQYADDSQVYLTVPISEAASAVDHFSHCVADLSKWLSSSRLRLNPAKTLVIWLGGRQQVTSVKIGSVPVLSSTVTTVERARDLGVVLDSQLTMSAHVSSVCRSAYHQLRQLRPINRSLSVDVAKMLDRKSVV